MLLHCVESSSKNTAGQHSARFVQNLQNTLTRTSKPATRPNPRPVGPAGPLSTGQRGLWYRERPPGGVNKQDNTRCISQTQTANVGERCTLTRCDRQGGLESAGRRAPGRECTLGCGPCTVVAGGGSVGSVRNWCHRAGNYFLLARWQMKK